jgi:tRNA dimethylallyltransferase
VNKVIVIFGPTASGKTKLSIDIAKYVNGEIISADSMQIYKNMNIGTAKPTEEERCGIPHYLIDEILPSEEFSVAKYKELATKYIREIHERGKVPIIVGGTGLYINSVIENIDFSDTICDWDLRKELQEEARIHGNQYVHDKLKDIDKEAASKIHANDTKRVIRAIEVYKHTNKTITQHNEISKLKPSEFEFIKIGLTMERSFLYDRINKRVDIMIKDGLVEEVKELIKTGFDKYKISMQAIGYKEIISWIKGEITYEEAIELIKRDSRRYAKRQITWFKRVEDTIWVDYHEYEGNREFFKKIKYLLA